MHKVSDLPHQSLVTIDEGLRGGAIVVEARRGHGLLELADRGFAFGNACLELVDALLVGLRGALTLPRFSVAAFLLFACLLRGGRW